MSPRSKEELAELALTPEEYRRIVDLLDREPNDLELGIFSALWSEHCGYKHSKPLLRLLPSAGPHVLLELGQENAGAVDIGDGQAVVFKIESHNHPSAVEPFQGAATGVGGIVRDILAMGARPIALLNSLRFGPLDDPRQSPPLRRRCGRHLLVRQLHRRARRRRRNRLLKDLLRQSPRQRPLRWPRRKRQAPQRHRRRPGQPSHPHRLRHRPRRHSRRFYPRLAHLRVRRGDAPHRTGGQPLPGKGPHRSLPGSRGFRRSGWTSGSGRRRTKRLHHRSRGPGWTAASASTSPRCTAAKTP